MSYHIEAEIRSQPACWRTAIEVAKNFIDVLPPMGSRVAVTGCGTSFFMAQAYAAFRESAGHGETDAFPASEMPLRSYEHVVLISRSGSTTEVLNAFDRLPRKTPKTVITASGSSLLAGRVTNPIVLDFADEKSIVQTRFATSALVMMLHNTGGDVESTIDAAEKALILDVSESLLEAKHFTFLGSGWTIGIAQEAALKLGETSLTRADAYPAMEFRHGPISLSEPGVVVWTLGDTPVGLVQEVRHTGALVEVGTLPPLAELVRVHKLAVARALQQGHNPDSPRNLSRSVILDPLEIASDRARQDGEVHG